jgi:hypothetical protein
MLLVACGGDKATGPGAISGNYTLRTVNGNNVPAVFFQDSQEKDEFLSGNINIAGDNTWSGTFTLRGTDLTNGQTVTVPIPIGGTYALGAGSITLTDARNQLVLNGTVGGGTLTVGSDAFVLGETTALVFKK